MWSGFRKCPHSWEGPRCLLWLAHFLRRPRSGAWAEAGFLCPGVDPPRAQGKAVVLGVSWTPVSAFSPPGGAWGSGVGMSSSSTMFSGWNQRRGGARAPSTGTPEAQVGSHSHGHRGTGRRRVTWLRPCRAEHSAGQRWAGGPAEQVGLSAFSKLGAVLEEKVRGWEEDVGEGKPPGTWTPCPLFVLKFHPPLLWGNASFFFLFLLTFACFY